MEIEHNLSEYGKSILKNIKIGIDIYKSKLVEEKERFDFSIVRLLKSLTQIKDNFIFRTAQIEQKYFEINSRIEFIQKQNITDIVGNANEINCHFCSVNKEFADFLCNTRIKIKNEIFQEGSKFFYLECKNIERIIPNNSPQYDNSRFPEAKQIITQIIPSSGINNSNAHSNTESTLGCSKPNMNNYTNFDKNSLNEKNIFRIPQSYSNWVSNADYKIKSNFNDKKDSLIFTNNNKFYSGVKEKRTPPCLSNSHENENNFPGKETFNNNIINLLDNSHYWDQADSNSARNNGHVDPLTSEEFRDENASGEVNVTIKESQNNQTEKLLFRKRFKQSKANTLDHKWKKIISERFNKNKKLNESHCAKEHKSLSHFPLEKSISKKDLDIANALRKKFPDSGIDFTTMLDYLKNKVINCFEFNLMNNQTMFQQIDNFLNSLLIEQDCPILIKLTISSDECNVKSPLYDHLIELFEQRCGAFRKNEMYIGGFCNISLRELFKEVSSDSYLRHHKILNVKISIYNFFEDILNDLEDSKPTCKTSNLSRKEEKEKNYFRMILKNFRNEYEKIAK